VRSVVLGVTQARTGVTGTVTVTGRLAGVPVTSDSESESETETRTRNIGLGTSIDLQ
jgi:hypothetical protein